MTLYRSLPERSPITLRHPSLHFKRLGRAYSVRVGLDYRALALAHGDDVVWFWIGTHADYDDIIKSL